MAGPVSISSICFLLICLNSVLSLYEDQIGKFDWKQSFIGNIKYGSFDSVKSVIVATEENVLASLLLKNGNIQWRQVLEAPATNQIELLHVDKEVTTVSGGDHTWYVRGWDLNLGTLLWEWSLYIEKVTPAQWIVSHNKLIHILPVLGSHLEVTTYLVQTGYNNGKTVTISAPWITDLSKCVVADVYWACISSHDNNGQLYYLDTVAQTNKVYSVSIQSMLGAAPGIVEIRSVKNSAPDLLLVRNDVARYIRLKPDMPESFPYGLSDSVVVTSDGDNTFLLSSQRSLLLKFDLRIINLHGGSESLVNVDYNNESGFSRFITVLCKKSACRALFVSNDNSVSLLQLPSGKILWTREEALSHVVGTEFIELPVSEMDASIEHEFDSISGNPFSMLYHRLYSQMRQVYLVLTGQQGTLNNALVRDDFGLHKLIVVATRVGKLYALDSITGNIIWSRYFPGVIPFDTLGKSNMFLYVQRTARYHPLPAQCILLMRDKISKNGVMYMFDPIKGNGLQDIQYLQFHIEQAMLLPFEDENHLKGLMILSDSGDIYLYPHSTIPVLLKHATTTYLYTANSKTGTLQGLSLTHTTDEKIKATPTWTFNLGTAELVGLSVRPNIEKVHSQGRVLMDRSVLYKYVNPNLVAVATLIDDAIHKHVLSIYLIDGITGLVVYSAVHRRANKPVHLVHSENWLVYSYYNERFRRVELATVELYEGSVQTNSTAFSSHAVSQLPHQETQAYIFPAVPLAIQSTITERGITNKHILIALTNGGVTEVPWAFLEPRGSQAIVNPEEGYSIPYMPELPIPAEAAINYNQTLARIRGIEVSPARLESTCLVLVHGLDLYYTRVTPSKTFDLLKEDFDHWLIAVVLIGLIIASYATKHLASRKALKQAWK